MPTFIFYIYFSISFCSCIYTYLSFILLSHLLQHFILLLHIFLSFYFLIRHLSFVLFLITLNTFFVVPTKHTYNTHIKSDALLVKLKCLLTLTTTPFLGVSGTMREAEEHISEKGWATAELGLFISCTSPFSSLSSILIS